MKPLVYVAGPYASPDPVHNTHTIIKVGTELAEEGLVTPVLPHLSLLWHIVDPHPVDFWYDYDLEVMAHCQAVLRVPGASSGADREESEAIAAGIPVFYAKADLYAWAK